MYIAPNWRNFKRNVRWTEVGKKGGGNGDISISVKNKKKGKIN